MANNELYQLTLISAFQAQLFNNVFYYLQQSALPADDTAAADLATLFRTEVIKGDPFLTGLTFHSSVVWSTIRVVNVYDVTDFAENVDNTDNGGSSITPLPPYASIGFRTNWLGQSVHRGYKRFSGITEDVNTNGAVSSEMVAGAGAFATVLGSPLDDGIGHWTPVVVKRTKYITDKGTEAYRLPLNEADAAGKIFPALAWNLVSNLTTQNTRKFGRGA